jgi:signal transduction histidine kinase
VVYLIASSESISTGALIFFIPVALGSSAIFNYSKRKVALGFGIFTFTLCLLSLAGYSLLPYRIYTEEEMRLSFIINFFVAFPVSMMAIFLLIRMSHHNATKLLHSNSQMKKLNEELDRFVYSTSHDLRAPLLSLLGLLKLAESSESHEVANYHKMMHSRVQNLDKFIKDITDYSRNNRLLVVSEKVYPHGLVGEIWESLRYSTDAMGIEFINEIPEDFCFTNDNARLRVILSNLIANAIRYHDQRKEFRFIRVSVEQSLNTLSIKVQDNGQGISSEYQTKIFDMFFRGNESSQGSGLGLYIVKETLAKLSASIVLSSEPKEGSTFSINLPA